MAKIIGTHNSVTGNSPRNWVARHLSAFCKCQDRTLAEQLAAGINCFDIRVWMGKDGAWHYGHGLSEYECGRQPVELVAYLRGAVRKSRRLYVRLILERQCNGGKDAFRQLCDELEEAYKDAAVTFWEGVDKRTWTKLHTFATESRMCKVTEYHASVSGKGLLSVMPRLFNELHGGEYELKEGINLIDFA